MDKHREDLFNLIRLEGSPVTEEILCANLWCIFRSPGEEIPWYFFHESGKGVYNNLKEETEFDWELTDQGVLTMESEGSAITFVARHYRKIFLGFFEMKRNAHILLFDSDGAKEQMKVFSN